ncbi:MAG: hypothetical protein ACTSPY_11360 [Candidatus Helarchaeota archaeon]
MKSKNNSYEKIYNQLELNILIIKAINGLIFGTIGFYIYEIFHWNYIYSLLFWLLCGLIVPPILIYFIYRKKLAYFGKLYRIFVYGYGTYLIIYIIIYGILFLITSYI